MRSIRPPRLRQVIRTIPKRNTYSWPNQVQRDFQCFIRSHPRRIQSAFQPNPINRRIDGYCESSNIVGRRRFAFDGVDLSEAISQLLEKKFISLELYRRHIAVRDQQRQKVDPYLQYSSSCCGLTDKERRRKGFEPFDWVCSGTFRLGNVRRHRTSPEVPVRLTHQSGLAAKMGRVAPGDCSPEALTRSGQGDFHHPAPPLMCLVATPPISARQPAGGEAGSVPTVG